MFPPVVSTTAVARPSIICANSLGQRLYHENLIVDRFSLTTEICPGHQRCSVQNRPAERTIIRCSMLASSAQRKINVSEKNAWLKSFMQTLSFAESHYSYTTWRTVHEQQPTPLVLKASSGEFHGVLWPRQVDSRIHTHAISLNCWWCIMRSDPRI